METVNTTYTETQAAEALLRDDPRKRVDFYEQMLQEAKPKERRSVEFVASQGLSKVLEDSRVDSDTRERAIRVMGNHAPFWYKMQRLIRNWYGKYFCSGKTA